MPLAAPAFTPPPFQAMSEGKLLLMIFEAEKSAIADEVPEPLRPSGDNLCLAWIGDMRQPTHTINVYHECLTAIKTKYKRWTGWYINYLWVSHDMALTFSRELYGWPAQLCDDTPLKFVGSQIFGECRRYGEQLMRMSFNVTSPPVHSRKKRLEDEFFSLIAGDWLQVRKFPSPETNGMPIKQLFLIPTTDFKLHEIWSGPAVLELGNSGYYPHLDKLNPNKLRGAWYLKSEWTVPHAKLLWEKGRQSRSSKEKG